MDKEKTLKKLRFDPAARNLILNAPDFYRSALPADQFDDQIDQNKLGEYDFVQVFAVEQLKLEELVQMAKPAAKYDAVFWACYPKGTGKIKSDIKRETVWEAFDKAGIRAVTAISIDETWSALRARPHDAVGQKKG